MKQFSMFRLVLPALLLVFGAANALAQVAPQAPVAPVPPAAPAPPAPGFKSQNERFVFKNDWDPTLVGHRQHDPCRVFIGVGTTTEDGKLVVSYTVDNTPATTYGIQAGDVILAIDNVPVTTQSELMRQRDTHQEGDAFTLTLVRNGQNQTVNARFRSCTEEERENAKQQAVFPTEEFNQEMEKLSREMEKLRISMENMPAMHNIANMELKERPILGFYPDESANVSGMLVGNLISGKGAEAAGLQRGDIIKEVNGKSINGPVGLRTAIGSRKVGEVVNVTYEREGRTYQTEVTLSADRSYSSYRVERDPCKVFIGVYTTETGNGQGVRVTGIIDETPAKLGGVQPGDIITALDGAPIANYQQLRIERDKHEPGDDFQLTVLRDGALTTVDATFVACDDQKPTVKEEKVTLVEEKAPVEQDDPPLQQQNLLELTDFNAYPNPTFGPLNIRFEAKPLPTTIRIFDITGKVVYDKVLNQFNGSFNEQINLVNNKPGNFILQVQQDGKTFAKKIVLMPRA
ncbi:MAG: PDZ domain-containing protein [Saprospiraceae bacterium]|nr:PDZ domain-containing protein [Saprospiraceae bacterium]